MPTELEVDALEGTFIFQEIFTRPAFTDKDINMIRIRNRCARIQRQLPLSHMQAEIQVNAQPYDKCGPCAHIYRQCGLYEKSYPADWLNTLIPLTPQDSMEDLSEVDMTGDRVTEICVSNLKSTKARKVNADEVGHILQEGTKISLQATS